MSILDKIFLAYDVRGRVGTQLSVDLVRKIGMAYADWLPNEGAVAIGRDMRPDSEELANALIEGLIKQGRDVINIGQVTSDMIYFAVGDNKLAGGAVVTASHNPGDFNGIKFCREGAIAVGVDTGLNEIKTLVENDKFKSTSSPGELVDKDVSEDWISHVLSFIDSDSLKPLKIAVDAGNGMAGAIFPELEPFVPFEVKEMYFELDGSFPNHIANPLVPENLVDLQKEMKNNKYDAGVAFDGDGDRAVLLDENGKPLTGTVMSALLSKYFLNKQPDSTILLNAICGKAAHDAVAKYGGNSIRTKVGHSYIKAKMREHDALFAGEHSGHYYFRDNYYADSGLIAATIGLAILSASGKHLSELAQPYRESYVQIDETNFEVKDKSAVLARIKEAYPNNKTDELDGVTVFFDNGWLNVRPSNTEQLLRLNVEADNRKNLVAIVNKVTKIIIS